MNCCRIQLLDLPNEILLLILRRLGNIDVLYSLVNSGNQRLDTIAQDPIFTGNLNFTSISSNDDICPISDSTLNRFCFDILPRIHQCVKSLILESSSMDRILFAANYPNLTQLKLFNFNQEVFSRYFTEDFLFRHIHREQLTHLTLTSKETEGNIRYRDCTRDVYAEILISFTTLQDFTIVPSSVNGSSYFSLRNLPPITFSSSTLTRLCIHVSNFDTCLALLDGRLKQLTTFIVKICYFDDRSSTSSNKDELSNLKCFSLIADQIKQYDDQIVPLLRRMSSLEELTLYLSIWNRSTFIDGSHLQNEILAHMVRLNAFTFYINTQDVEAVPTVRLSNDDLQRTFTNVGIRQVVCLANYGRGRGFKCHAFSLPFKFHRLANITNNLPNIVFDCVTYLELSDTKAFKYAFFVRVAQCFPSLKYLSVRNLIPSFWILSVDPPLAHDNWCSIIEYPHLISLNICLVDVDYVENFLNHTKTHLPRLMELKVKYDQLETVTENFTRAVTRNNCANVKRLILEESAVDLKDIHHYFPSLPMKECPNLI